MAFEKSFDDLLNDILTDYRNQFPEADLSQGSLIFIKSSCLASALWGLYKYQEYISRQIFPDTADEEHLLHHVYIRGVPQKTGETSGELLARLLEYIRRPPAGGNKYDYVKWALEVTDVAKAWCIPLAQGPGTTDVVILADAENTGAEIPDQALLDTARAYIVDICPTSVKTLRVLAPTVIAQNVTMTGTELSDTAALENAISSYLSGLIPGQTLYRTQLSALALSMGAIDAVIATPAANVSVTSWQMIRPGVISVA